MKQSSSKAGFTLVELVVVIAILAILAGIAIPVYSAYITRARDAAVEAELVELVTAVRIAEILCRTEVDVITVDETGFVRCYIGADRDEAGSILSYHEFDISDVHSGVIGSINSHSSFAVGCTWLRNEGKWHSGVEETPIFGTNPAPK